MSTTKSQSATAAADASPGEWWREFFDDDYADWGLAAKDPAENEELAAFIVKSLGLEPGGTLLDQCCGIGRLSIPIAAQGVRVIGVDITPSYIERATEAAAARNLPCEFYVGDAADFTARAPCDAALNFFTSFGYSEDDAHTQAMVQRLADSLKPGGRALVEYQNVPRIMAEFQRGMVSRPPTPEGLIIAHEHTADWERGMFRATWTMIYPDNRRVVREVANRMFMPHEIVRMMREAGFGEFELLGSHTGEEFTRRSMRLIVIGRKAADRSINAPGP